MSPTLWDTFPFISYCSTQTNKKAPPRVTESDALCLKTQVAVPDLWYNQVHRRTRSCEFGNPLKPKKASAGKASTTSSFLFYGIVNLSITLPHDSRKRILHLGARKISLFDATHIESALSIPIIAIALACYSKLMVLKICCPLFTLKITTA